MDHDEVWRDGDLAAVERLFTDDARYRPSPTRTPRSATRPSRRSGSTTRARPSVAAWPVAVDGDHAVVRVDVGYSDPVTQEYRDVWLLRFAADGRVDDFEEWAYWPGLSPSATSS